MFNKEYKKRRGSFLPFVIFRMLLSLTMIGLFGLGILQAYRYFSGVDPLKVDPKAVVLSLITSERASELIKQVLGVKLPGLNEASKNSDLLQSFASNTATHSGKPLYRLALVADSHNDNIHLQKALSQAKDEGAKFVIGLGDFSDVGTSEELGVAKRVFEASGLPFYVTAGDHDLWDARNRNQDPVINFSKTFGSPYQSFAYQGVRFLIVYNADNYQGLGSVQPSWLEDQLAQVKNETPKATIVLLHEPLSHPSSDHFMGKEKPELIKEAKKLAKMFKEAGVKVVFAGDTHFFTQYKDPDTDLDMVTVGALVESRNAQKPRFALVDIFEDGSYSIQDVEVK